MQTVQVQEILVVDSQSTDETVKIAELFGARVLTVDKKNFDHGGTRNWAAANTLGDILIFMTQDAIPVNKDMIAELIQPFKDPTIMVAYARQLPKENTVITDRYLRAFNYPEQSVVRSQKDIQTMGMKAFKNSNACAAYRAREFKKLGGFHAPVVSNEDMLFAAKAILAGYQVAYTAKACVWHSHNYGCWSLFKRYFDIGASLDYTPIVKQNGQSESEGFAFVINEFKYLIKQRKLHFLPLAFGEACFKYAGYKLGVKHKIIPPSWKKYLGLQRQYWENCEQNRRLQ